jgi:hypothetical protein
MAQSVRTLIFFFMSPSTRHTTLGTRAFSLDFPYPLGSARSGESERFRP